MTSAPLNTLAGRRFEAVLFDLDGTLIDSTGCVERCWRQWAQQRGLSLPDGAVPHGVPARQVLAELVPPQEIEAAFIEIEKLEVSDTQGVLALPGAVGALSAVAGHCAIVTSGTPPLVHARTAAVGLRLPAVVVTADDVPRGKPDPAPYLLAAQRLGVDPARCLVVEDAPAGLTAGRAAGCATLAVSTTFESHDLDADAVVATLGEVEFQIDHDDLVSIRPARKTE